MTGPLTTSNRGNACGAYPGLVYKIRLAT